MAFASKTRHSHDVLSVRMSRSHWWGKQSSRCDIVSYCLHRLWMNLDGSLILSRPLRLCSFRSSTYEAVLAGRMYNGPAVLDSGWSAARAASSQPQGRPKISKAEQTTHVLYLRDARSLGKNTECSAARSDRTHAWNRTESNKAKEGKEP